MGKVIFILVVLGIVYAWHEGLLDRYLRDPPTARYKPSDRYGDAAMQTPQERCAAARAQLEEQETMARGPSGVIDPNVENPALDAARRGVQKNCPS
ncbi:MAG TPA: hypothetical protein VFC18_13345 [Burkholderiales bacterium]|nr:hypothetical protein [Burkholderiales bacterium]